MRVRGPRRGWAKITLGISLLFAVGVFVVLSLSGNPVYGALAGMFVLGAGVWEWRHKLREEIRAERIEADAERSRRK